MKALLLELDENGLKKKKKKKEGFLGPVITGKSLKKLTQMFTEGKPHCNSYKMDGEFQRHGTF